MASIANLIVELTLNSAKFQTEMERTRKSVDRLKKDLSVIKLDALVNLGARAVSTAKQIYELGKSAASSLNDIERMSGVLNMSTKSFQEWTHAAYMADVNTESFMMGMRLLMSNIIEGAKGTGDAAAAFKALGINVKDSNGKLKSSEVILEEVIKSMDKFATDANKDAAGVALFGKQWQTIKPFITQGTQAIEEAKKRAQELGLVYGVDLVKAGGQAETTFKELGAVMTVFKNTVMMDAIKDLSTFLKLLLEIRKFVKDATHQTGDQAELDLTRDWIKKYETGGLTFGGSNREAKLLALKEKEVMLQESLGQLTAPSWVKDFVKNKLKEKPSMPPPAGGGGSGAGRTGDVWAEMQEGFKDFVEQMPRNKTDVEAYMEEPWDQFEKNFREDRIADIKILGDENKAFRDTASRVGELYEKLYGFPSMENSARTDALIENSKKRLTEVDNIVKSIGDSFGNTLVNNMTMLMSSTDKWGEKFKKVGESILQTIMQIIAQQLVMNALFGNSEGKTGTGWGTSGQSGYGGLIGIVGNLIGGIALQEGGIVTKPTAGIIGEAGPEAVIPLDKAGGLGGGGDHFIMIQAVDSKSFVDMLEKNPEAILSIVSKSDRTAGVFRELKRY